MKHIDILKVRNSFQNENYIIPTPTRHTILQNTTTHSYTRLRTASKRSGIGVQRASPNTCPDSIEEASVVRQIMADNGK
jgi:hypothetical protein